MDDQLKIWTTVGSAGTLTVADLAKVSMAGSVVQLGTILVRSAGELAAPRLDVTFATEHATIRYNVTPVDGLFVVRNIGVGPEVKFAIRYLGRVTADLIEVDLETGAETRLFAFDSRHQTASDEFQVYTEQVSVYSPFDFENKAYFVAATLTATWVPGGAAAISIIKLCAVTQLT